MALLGMLSLGGAPYFAWVDDVRLGPLRLVRSSSGFWDCSVSLRPRSVDGGTIRSNRSGLLPERAAVPARLKCESQSRLSAPKRCHPAVRLVEQKRRAVAADPSALGRIEIPRSASRQSSKRAPTRALTRARRSRPRSARPADRNMVLAGHRDTFSVRCARSRSTIASADRAPTPTKSVNAARGRPRETKVLDSNGVEELTW